MAKQHVISEWLLRAFAGSRPLVRYDKRTGEYDTSTPADFLTEVDAHSEQIEQDIQGIETPASAAAQRLRKRVISLPPGLYAVEGDEPMTFGPETVDVAVFEQTRLLVTSRTIPSPSMADRLALARYVALMFQRAPKMEAALLDLRRAMNEGAKAAFEQLLPGLRTDRVVEGPGPFIERRQRIAALADSVAPRLAEANWWAYRVRHGDAFILGDSPVPVTLSPGYEDDVWHGLLSDTTYAAVLPLGPLYAVIIAPQRIIPITEITPDDLPATINRMMLRWADRCVVARERAHIEAVVASVSDARHWDVPIKMGTSEAVQSGVRMAQRIAWEVTVRHAGLMPREQPWWDGCVLRFSLFPWPAADRPHWVAMGALPPPCRLRREVRPWLEPEAGTGIAFAGGTKNNPSSRLTRV